MKAIKYSSFAINIFLSLVILASGCNSKENTISSKSFETVAVERDSIAVSISATGTVEPVEVVDIGAQIVGQILELGNDINGKRIDYGSVVDEGAVLARIDDRLYVADQKLAEANLKRAVGENKRAQANFYIADRDWKRAEKIGSSEALSKSSYDTYKSNYDGAAADVISTQAAVSQAEATLDRAQLNVKFCTIKSPVKGTVVDKKVNIGQTVVSSFNAPSLFLIAKDLTKIQVWVSVNEADISSLFPGQSVNFGVDAYPDRIFTGKVNKIRLNASMVQNVVSYIVEVDTDNADGKLLPYLTANVRFEAGNASDALLVPSAALKWTPGPDVYSGAPLASDKKYVWTIKDDVLQPHEVTLGLSNGTKTEVKSQTLEEGMEVVTAVAHVDRANAETQNVNPFVPKMRGGGGRRQ